MKLERDISTSRSNGNFCRRVDERDAHAVVRLSSSGLWRVVTCVVAWVIFLHLFLTATVGWMLVPRKRKVRFRVKKSPFYPNLSDHTPVYSTTWTASYSRFSRTKLPCRATVLLDTLRD